MQCLTDHNDPVLVSSYSLIISFIIIIIIINPRFFLGSFSRVGPVLEIQTPMYGSLIASQSPTNWHIHLPLGNCSSVLSVPYWTLTLLSIGSIFSHCAENCGPSFSIAFPYTLINGSLPTPSILLYSLASLCQLTAWEKKKSMRMFLHKTKDTISYSSLRF